MIWKVLALVGLGSFAGGSLRYLCTLLVDQRLQGPFPWGTLAVNVAGSFAIGVALPVFLARPALRDSAWPLLVSVGFLGSFTTFSTFSLQTFNRLQESDWSVAAANAAASVAGCLLAVYLGYRFGHWIVARD